jgi:hypothetical protein
MHREVLFLLGEDVSDLGLEDLVDHRFCLGSAVEKVLHGVFYNEGFKVLKSEEDFLN